MNQISHDRQNKLAVLLGVPTAAGVVLLASESASAEVPAEVQSVVTNTTDTVAVLSGIALAIFGAGLAPWAARTTLSWLSAIMRGSI